jgi:Xaa-Pro aminopeptidase
VNARIERLRAGLDEPLLVTTPTNVLYLTGLSSSNAVLLVPPDDAPTLYTDFRYAPRAREVEGVDFVETPRAIVGALAAALSGQRIAFEADHLVYSHHEALREGGVDLVPRNGLVERLRAVKDEQELDALRRAAAASDRAFERLAREPFRGRTERELAWLLEQLLHEEGGQGMSFPTVVAGGPTGSSPHARPGERAIDPRDAVVVDAGCVVDHYCSDCTRTFAVGELDARLRDAYDVCLQAQLAGLEAMRAGVAGSAADAAARAVVDATEFRGTFGHGLGHGIGLLVQEAPVARPESTDTLEPGNVLSCEPGIYLAGVGGIRIEDMVLVTDDAPERLTTFTKELVVVD